MILDNRPRTSTVLITILAAFAMLGCQAKSSAPDMEADSATPSAAAMAADAPTSDELANATYEGIYDQPVTLADGGWEGEPFEPGAASRPTVGLVKHFWMSGDLDGDGVEEAVVLLWESSGGSGTENYVAAVGRRDGEIVNLGTALMGDRVQLKEARITDGKIELDVVQAGPEDAMCCPSQKATRVWALGSNGLDEVASEVTGTLSTEDLAGPEWVLTHFNWDDPAPAEPEVTLVYEEGRLAGASGCNRYTAGVEPGEMAGDMVVGPAAGTRMACPEEIMALEDHYLAQLGEVSGFGFLAGKLGLSWSTDDASGVMLFRPRERAEE
ncbi:MAG: META domain-containing protein [Thermoanaerobaculia bacterium]